METTIKITNEELFDSKVAEVDTSRLSSTDYHNGRLGQFYATGYLSIELKNGKYKESHGEFGSKDYQSEFGFILKCAS